MKASANCKGCAHSDFTGDKDERGREIGLCAYNPPAVVVIHVPDAEAMKSQLAQLNARSLSLRDGPKHVDVIMREIPIGAFPVVLATMRCRQFEPKP